MSNTSTQKRRPASPTTNLGTLLGARFHSFPAWVVLTQLFIGLGWMRAVAEKLIDPAWWSGEVIEDFAAAHGGSTLGWYRLFVDLVVLPQAALVGIVVVVGQLIAGLSLITGRALRLGIGVGMFLNVNFLATGAVAPSAFYLLAQGAMLLWLVEQHPSRPSNQSLQIAGGIAGILAGASLPFVSTLHPAEVIDDPAMMFVFGGALSALGCLLVGRFETTTQSALEAPGRS